MCPDFSEIMTGASSSKVTTDAIIISDDDESPSATGDSDWLPGQGVLDLSGASGSPRSGLILSVPVQKEPSFDFSYYNAAEHLAMWQDM